MARSLSRRLFTLLGATLPLGCSRGRSRDPEQAAAARSSAKITGATAAASSKVYAKATDLELRQRLSPLEYAVTQHAATEPPFQNRFFDHHAQGLYVDIVSGEPLFSSLDKFDSGTGWPSFKRPVDPERVVARPDHSHGMTRTEVRSRDADSHLGHLFDDGPPPSRVRYCINSAALRFIPVEELTREGYAEYLPLFAEQGEPSPGAWPSEAASGNNSCAAPAPGARPGCSSSLETAILAGGCFWGMEEILRKIPGVLSTEVGYTGGTAGVNYEAVHTGKTGNAEAVRVVFDPQKLSFETLLADWFFRMHDPTTPDRQGNDVGTQYRSAVFVTSPEQRAVAERVKARIEKSGVWGKPILTEITDSKPFTLAEDYHQDYLQKNPGGYTCHYLRDFPTLMR